MKELTPIKINLKKLILNCIFAGLLAIWAGSPAAAQTNNPACEFEIDCDSDDILFDVDNCPETYNPGQQDADNDGKGDACDGDTIYGNISGEFSEGIDVNISTVSCSGEAIVATLTTDEDGYYAIGDLNNKWYIVSPQAYDYIFYPNSAFVTIGS